VAASGSHDSESMTEKAWGNSFYSNLKFVRSVSEPIRVSEVHALCMLMGTYNHVTSAKYFHLVYWSAQADYVGKCNVKDPAGSDQRAIT
jgi:hypothetical protein